MRMNSSSHTTQKYKIGSSDLPGRGPQPGRFPLISSRIRGKHNHRVVPAESE